MDPSSALSVASGVLTFVDFAGKLISTGNEIYRSNDGSTQKALQLDDVYSQLQELSKDLQRETSNAAKHTPGLFLTPVDSPDFTAINNLAAACQADCGELLSGLQSIQGKKGAKRQWQSIKAAFREVLGQEKISGLEAKLQRTQSIISLRLNFIIRCVLRKDSSLCCYSAYK